MEEREDWDLIREKLKKLSRTGVCHYGNVDKVGNFCSHVGPCHQFAGNRAAEHRTIFTLAMGDYYDRNYKNLYGKNPSNVTREWFRWLVSSDSPFAELDFLCSPDEAAELGVIAIGNLDKAPSNLVWECLIASRLTAERARRGEMWDELVQAGEDPALAALISLVKCGSGHSVWPVGHYVSNRWILGWCKRDPAERWEPWNSGIVRNSGGRTSYSTWGPVTPVVYNSNWTKIKRAPAGFNRPDLMTPAKMKEILIYAQNP